MAHSQGELSAESVVQRTCSFLNRPKWASRLVMLSKIHMKGTNAMSATETKEYLSSGKLCELLQHSPAEIRKAAEAAGVQPAMRLNCIPYYADESVSLIRAALPAQTTKGNAP